MLVLLPLVSLLQLNALQLPEPLPLPRAPLVSNQPVVLSLFSSQAIENAAPLDAFPPQEAIQTQEIRALPGKLDTIPVFNSNSPETVQTEGILLSTFPPEGKRFPAAHLNFPFQGRFDIFAHHIAKAQTLSQTRTLFFGIIVNNPSDRFVTVDVLQGASYLTQPDALFVDLPDYVEDPLGKVFAGPGSRAMSDVLRGRRQATLPARLVIPPRHDALLMNVPIPVGSVVPASNGRSTLLRLNSTGPVYVASMAMSAPLGPGRRMRTPTLQDWEAMLQNGRLAGPRDLSPTPPYRQAQPRLVYGRVAGVAQGSRWEATLTDNAKATYLTVPKKGQAFSYGLSTLPRGTLGTGQIQSASLLVRYPDTAYLANGNYGIEYNLKLPLYNPTRRDTTVMVTLQTPLKADAPSEYIRFFDPPEERIFFRGPVRISYSDEDGSTSIRYLHLVQRRGEQGKPLLKIVLKPGERREVEVDLLYPPDATPPQILTVQTIDDQREGSF
jgi:hypothetical protein